MITKFKHIQSAHCENGVASNLLNYNGLDFVNEPLVFGLGSGIFYIHIPFLMVNNGPAVSYRTMPGLIFKRACKALKVGVVRKKYRQKQKAQQELDELLHKGIPVGCQVGVFHLPYFPPEYRFHFNAHNIVVYGKEGENYLVSDPVMETTTTLTAKELEKVRFAEGMLAPKGQLYYTQKAKPVEDKVIENGIKKAIKRTSFEMSYLPGNFVGIQGIKYTGNQIRKWRDKYGVRRAGLHLAQIVRMQEEIGTGGGGFRFLYAAFLEQANNYWKNDALLEASEMFTKSGDLWRDSAVEMAGIYKGRITAQADFDNCANILYQISDLEKQAFKKLHKLK